MHVLGKVSAQILRDNLNDDDSTNHIFVNQYLVIASKILRANTIYKV